jgi:hypothetical protein
VRTLIEISPHWRENSYYSHAKLSSMENIWEELLGVFFHTDKVLSNIAPVVIIRNWFVRFGEVSKWV